MAQALGDFRPFFGAQAVTFLTIADARFPNSSHVGSVGVSPAALVDYHTHFCAHDEWVLAATARPDFGLGAVYCGSELVNHAHLRRSYFWREFVAHTDVSDILCVIVEMSATDGPTTFLTFQRQTDQPPFDHRDAQRLATLGPHLRNVLRLHRRLTPALALGSTLAELVRDLELPVCFVGAEGELADANPAALVALSEGQWLRRKDATLEFSTLPGWRPIGSALDSLRSSVNGNVALDLVGSHRRCATLHLRAVHGASEDQLARHPAVAVASLKVGARDKERALRAVYGLTPAEARVALQLSNGRSVAEIAQASGIALTTLRSHVAAARVKLVVSRQAHIVARVLEL